LVSVNQVGCANGATQLTTNVSGDIVFPTTLRFRTIVDAGGLRYMDEDAGTPGSLGNYGWSLYTSSSGGPITASFPLPPDTPFTVQLLLIDGIGGPTVSSTVLNFDKCNGGSLIIGADCPYPQPADAALYQLPAGAPAFFAADLGSQTGFNIPAGTWYMSDFSDDFAKVWIACEAQPVYVPANAVLR
jgi:hypothetical protein